MQYCEFPIYPFKPNLLNIQIFISFIKSKVLENPLRRVCDAAPFLGNCTVLTHGFLWRQKFLVQDSLGIYTCILSIFRSDNIFFVVIHKLFWMKVQECRMMLSAHIQVVTGNCWSFQINTSNLQDSSKLILGGSLLTVYTVADVIFPVFETEVCLPELGLL